MNARANDLALGVALIAVAGCVDAIGFLRITKLFVSFMSGNSTQLAIALVSGNRTQAERAAAIVALFVSGGIAGRAIVRSAGSRGRSFVLAFDAALLAVAAAMHAASFANVVPMVLAMGAQNAALRRVGKTQTNLTYVTGTLVHLSEAIADAFWRRNAAWQPYALMWIAMVAGAAAGAATYTRFGMHALALPALAAAAFAIVSASGPSSAHRPDRQAYSGRSRERRR